VLYTPVAVQPMPVDAESYRHKQLFFNMSVRAYLTAVALAKACSEDSFYT